MHIEMGQSCHDYSAHFARNGLTSDSRAIFLEVKKPGKKMTPAQAHFIDCAKSAGCIAAMVWAVDQAAAVLAEQGAWK